MSVPCNMRANCWHSVVRSVARKEGQGRVREDEQTRGRRGPGARAEREGREGVGGLPRTLLRTVLALAKRTKVGRDSEGERAHKEGARRG